MSAKEALALPTYGKQDRRMILQVDAPHFCAGSLWRKETNGSWACYHAAPIIRWMIGKSAVETKNYLEKKGWTHQWISTP